MKVLDLWENVPALNGETPVLEYYPAKNKATDAAVVVFPGGGYGGRAPKEGDGYAVFLNSIGMDAYVCEYRVAPYRFPIPLLDARRAVRYVRYHAEKLGVDPDKIAVMGSSAGGHLAALVSTYKEAIDFEGADEIDGMSPIPNATILCYPVIHHPDDECCHKGSYYNLTGDEKEHRELSPDLLVDSNTPKAFIWHTSNDGGVSVINSYLYATALRKHNILHEMHIFPDGPHGLDIAAGMPHVAQWTGLLKNWFTDMGWL
ncbi:MAG: alpha/beta hydrolase [Clostridia bacterium]|nr:alpha/beta hydrolase [Clostridia bacterium]